MRKITHLKGVVTTLCAAVLCVGIGVGVTTLQGTPVDNGADELLVKKDTSTATYPLAENYAPESEAQFAQIMHIDNGSGEALTLADLPAGSYSGFLFSLADTAQGAGEVASVAKAAEAEGLITQVHGSLYEVTSLDTLAGLFTADQLEYVEPDTTVYLVGDIDDDVEPSATDVDESSSALAASASSADAALANSASATSNAATTGDLGNAARATEALTTQGGTTLTTQGGTNNNPAPTYPPSDPYYLSGNLWNLDMLKVEGAWALGLDGDPYVHNSTPVRDTQVRVAVIDTGLYGTGTSESKHEDIDYTHVVDGHNFTTSDEGEPDVKGHGTFVSGLIAAKVNNNVGVAGIMPGVDIVPCKVFDSTTAATSDVVDAIYYAVDDAHVDVINMSLGGEYNATSLQSACDYAVEQGVLVVASAGNDGVSTPNYPAAYDSVVGVASVNSSQERSTWSQYGKSVFVTGPGENVTSTYNESATSYKTASGTSFSSPEVAALAAMCRSVYPDMTQDVFKEFLIETSTDLGTKGFDDYYGYGLVNFEAMAQAVLASQTLPWYSLSFNVTDTAGASIQGATVVLKAAENITWADDPDEGIEAGSLATGDVVEAQSDGTFKVHRGVYSYEVSADGYYLGSGTLKTYSAEQTVDVSLEDAYEVVVNVKNSAGDNLSGIHLAVTSSTGRTETPKANDDGSFVYNLMSGVYSFEASAPASYEKASGQFTVQRENKQLTITLNSAAELATVSLGAHDAEEQTALASVSTAVYDAQGMLVSAREDGTYRLARGKEYKAILTRLGYEDAIATFTVDDAETMSIDVAMTAAECSISFRPVTEDGGAVNDATIVVTDASGKVKSSSATDPLRYNLKAGTYSYTLSAPGYEDVVANFSVSIESRTLTIVMSGIPQTVSFSLKDAKTGQALEGASVKVTTATNDGAIRANSDGTYSLAPGEYRYSAYCLNYQSKRGSFTVYGDTLSIDIALDPYSGSTEGFAGGTGTVDDPYLIATEDQLRYLANQTDVVRAGRMDADTNQERSVEGYYQLVQDIELTSEWLPIGNYENSNNYVAFSGTFDGAGHTISGLNTVESDYDAQGLFGMVQNATITNLTVEGSVTGDSYVGGIVGYVRFFYDSEGSDWNTGATRISNCCNRASVTGRYAVGGIAGSTSGSSSSSEDYGTLVSQCSNYGVIHAQRNGDFDKHSSAAGGIVGSAGNCKVEYCYNRTTVEAGYVTGGIVGQSLGLAAIYNCYNTGYVYDHVTAAGYTGNSGSIAGRLVKSALSGCYGLIPADESAIYTPVGTIDTSTTVTNYKMYERASMWRSDDFVATLNLDALTDTMTTSFVAGGSYPLLKWEVSSDAILAEDPYVTLDPISPKTSYKQGTEAVELTAEVDPVADGGVLSWQWFEIDDAAGTGNETEAGDAAGTGNETGTGDETGTGAETGTDAVAIEGATPIEGATGTGTHATYTPSTADIGTRHYFVVFTNTLTADDGRSGSATAQTASATVIIRSAIDAQEPTVTAYNPSAAQQFNTSLSTKITTDLMLSVEASSKDGGTLSYQWYKGASMVGSGTPIEGATSATYYPDTSALGTLYYYVEITNTYEPGNTASVKTDWASVTVTEYTISSYEELMSFRTAVDSGVTFEGLVVTLTCDLDVSRAAWEPIGSVEHPFKGTFMGGTGYSGSAEITTHTISGIHIDGAAIGAARGSEVEGADALGFFGVTEAATICDLVVEGSITGKANRYAGLIVGYALSNSSSATVIENCATQASSSVEGKYCIGGLVGYGCVSIKDSANHGSVTAWGFVPTKNDSALDTYSYTTKAAGGVVGYAAAGSVRGCYNTGEVTVKPIDTTAGEKSVYYVGGVVGYGSTSASVLSCFDTGTVTVGTWATTSISFKPAGVCFAGAVVGYQAYDYLYNIHYLDGAAGEDGVGTNSSAGYDFAENHTLAFMKTAYFLGLMQDGYGYGAAFRQSTNGAPHLLWETDETTGSNLTDAAEPYLYDVTIDGVDDITKTWSTYFYQGENAPDVVVWADQAQPEGGHLTYEWQSRPVGGADADWTVVEGAFGTCTQSGDHYTASLPINTETVGAAEYRCVVINTLDGATGVATCDNEIPALTIEIREDIGTFALSDPSQKNSASNPWVIKTPEQLHFLALLVNGETKMVGVDDSSFYQQYLVIDADLDLSGYERWEPIGTGDGTGGSPFKGILDGQGRAITGLQIGTQSEPAAAADYQGLFGSVYYGALRNLCVSGTVNIASGGWMTGGVAAYAYGAAFENVANHVNVTGSVRVGGIAGTIGTCQLKDCYNDGTITVAESSSTSQYAVGGIAGYAFFARSDVEGAGLFNCFNAGNVSCTLAYGTDPRFGALIGDDNTDSTPLSHCYYVKGSATCLNDGSAGTGVGNTDGCLEDVEGSFEAVESASDPRVAWVLNTGNGDAKNSERWGVTGKDGAVALAVCGTDPVYHVNTDADAAQITVSDAYVTAGTEVTVTWREKPGFLVSDVSYGLADADQATYTSLKDGDTFTMPAGDVAFAITSEQDESYRYNLYGFIVDEQGTESTNAALTFDALDNPPTAREGDVVNVTLTVAQGYQVKTASAEGVFGTKVSVERLDGVNYRFTMPADLVNFTVVVEPEGSAAAKQASSLAITTDNVHIYNADTAYHTGNLVYDTLTLSGTSMGGDKTLTSYNLEAATSTPALYEQTYSFADGAAHRVTGVSVAALIKQFVDDPTTLTATTPVLIEAGDGSSYTCTWGELTALTYNAYTDTTGQPTVRALPALLAFGQDGKPYEDNALRLVFGATSSADDNTARCLSGVTRVAIGEDLNYSQHCYSTYTDLSSVGGSEVTVNIYTGTTLAGTKTYSVKDVEALANADRGGIYRGMYSTLVYEDNEENYSGPYSDYYEGYSLYDVLLDAGLPDSAAASSPDAKVQFYQLGEWTEAWKTVNVSLGYLAGNGANGVGDYSNNFTMYGREDGSDSDGIAIKGMAPTLAYGKNDLPLVYSSGSTGVSSTAYNYRGPLIALLPQNEAEGGYVANQTVSACYLGQIDVYLPAPEEPLFSVATSDISGASGMRVVTYTGDVPEGSIVQVAGKTMLARDGKYVCLLPAEQTASLTNDSFSLVEGDAPEIMRGDTNESKTISIIDAQIAYDITCGRYRNLSVIGEASWLAADFNLDGEIDASDALAIMHQIHENVLY